MVTNRVLSEDELTEQIRISAKKEILAVLKDGVPPGEKTKIAERSWIQSGKETIYKLADRNSRLKALQMLSPQDRAEVVKKKKLYLPE